MENLIANAVELMIHGMGTVFVFLALLVIVTSIMSAVAAKIAPPAPSEPPKRPSRRPGALEPRLQKAIELAVARYQKDH